MISGVDSEIDLIQLSAQVENWFTNGMVSADNKLAGAALSRFGGFLKRSWRMNDWIWGRLDAATLLCRAVLEPNRMRRVAEVAGLTRGTQAEARVPAGVNRLGSSMNEMPGRWRSSTVSATWSSTRRAT